MLNRVIECLTFKMRGKKKQTNNEKQILSLVKSQTYVLKIKCFFGLSSEKMDLIFATAWIYYWNQLAVP